jgi:hypothetical protein
MQHWVDTWCSLSPSMTRGQIEAAMGKTAMQVASGSSGTIEDDWYSGTVEEFVATFSPSGAGHSLIFVIANHPSGLNPQTVEHLATLAGFTQEQYDDAASCGAIRANP